MSVVFVTPLHGDREIDQAGDLGFNVTSSLSSIRIKGDNRPGIAAELTKKLEAENINIREVSVAVIGTKFLLYIGLDSDQDAIKAVNSPADIKTCFRNICTGFISSGKNARERTGLSIDFLHTAAAF
jgi:predicted amino acid-binding ACT domain protein